MCKNKILLSIICGIVILGLCGCFNSKEKKQNIQQAKENAINYIENKYGFTPEVISTKCTYDNNGAIVSNCNDEMLVNLKYNSKSFTVYISSIEESTDGIDNYQYDEIVSSLLKLMPDSNEIYTYNFYYESDKYNSRSPSNAFNGLIEEYYDGNNLKEIMENKYLRGIVNYVNHISFEYLKNNMKYRFPMFSKLFIVNYKSINSYENTSDYSYSMLSSYSFIEKEFYDNSQNLKDVATLIYGGEEEYYYNFN